MDGVGVGYAFAADYGVVALLHTVPAFVSVHAVEAALDGGDAGVAQLIALLLQLLNEACAALGGHVAAVQEAVDIYLLHAPLLCHIQDAEDMAQVAVDSAGGHEAQDVQGLALGLGVLHGLDVNRVLEELAVFNLLAHLGQDLEHNTACADIGMSHLGVAHLALRQTHIQSGGGELAAGVLGK